MHAGEATDKSPSSPKVVLEINRIKIIDLPNVGFPKRPGKFYVKLALGTEVQTTAVSVRGNVAVWDEKFCFDILSSSILDLQVYAHHRSILSDDHVGGISETVDKLLEQGTSGTMPRRLSKHDKHGTLREVKSTIEISAKSITTPTDVVELQMIDALAQMRNSSSLVDHIVGAVDGITSVMDNVIPIANTWDLLLKKIDLFTKIVDGIAEVHPYAKMAWTILSAAQKVVLAQRARDESINHLIETMADVYSFVQEAESLKKIESHKQILLHMAQQTVECGYFIRDYARNKNFGTRVLKNLISDVDDKIKQYETKFGELKLAFQGHAAIHTEITVLRVLNEVESIAANINLDDIAYAEGARYDPERQCLPGTREEVLREITDWVNSTDGQVSRMFVLSGVAGSGKSSIAHTIARLFDDVGRLGSSFCFDRSNQAKLRPDAFFSTIARDLADLDPQRKQSLCRVVQDKTALRKTRAPREQFEQLILKPAADLMTVGPVVIVIDAFDESGDEESRRVILSILAGRISELPPNFRVLVTARRETDIDRAFDGNPHVHCKLMNTIDMDSTNIDIGIFVRNHLADVAELDRKWPNQSWCGLLVNKSEGLFQWASTACRFIKGDGQHGVHPTEQLTHLLSLVPQNLNRLDQLYLDILKRLFPMGHDTTGLKRFKLVVGRIVAAVEPLTVAALKELCKEDNSIDVVELITTPMGSLFSGVNQLSERVRPLHSSLRDFLTNPRRSERFYIDIPLHERGLALACLRVMEVDLKFNICQLETSHLLNSSVNDLRQRIEKHIPSQLSYSCRFWVRHLQATACDVETLQAVKDFLYNRTLYWLEVLSLIKEISTASNSLSFLAKWSRAADGDSESFVADTVKFVIAFASVISQSTPHIYISALPFAPRDSKVAQKFLPQFPHILSLQTGQATQWPAIQGVFTGHKDVVSSVAFSPDGKRVASGSHDKTIRVWDAETGAVVSGPFEGHSSAVNCVAFSPDGKHVASGSYDNTIRVWDAETGAVVSGPFAVSSVTFSPDGIRVASGFHDKTIRVWDVETGAVVSGPFEGHSSIVSSIAFSPDRKRVASGSDDNTIRVWDAETGAVVSGPFEGHSFVVSSVAFSPDGKRVASGSYDKTIRVWDAETGVVVSGPFEGHSSAVSSVAFSPDGKCVASGSYDRTIRVWDAETGAVVSGPFEGHSFDVSSVAFSPDGKRVASGSHDKTIRVWDVETDTVVSGLFEGHKSAVSSVAFSPDGKHVASGSHDKTIRVWDAETGDVVSGPFEGHKSAVSSVAFSPDGKCVASGSDDNTICVWDAETGAVVSGPFEGHSFIVSSVAFSPDGKHVASGSYDKTIRVWGAETGAVVSGPFEGHSSAVSSVAFSPDGKRVASGSYDRTIRVWDAETGAVVSGPFDGHSSAVRSVAFSPDGIRVASGFHDKTIRVWDAETGAVVSGPFEGHSSIVSSVAFSPDGQRVASGSHDKTIRVWDAETGAVVSGPFEGHSSIVNSVAFSPDGKHVASGSHDDTIRVWDAETGAVISGPFEGHSSIVSSVAFSLDGKHGASGSHDRPIQMWGVDIALNDCQVLEEPAPPHLTLQSPSVSTTSGFHDGSTLGDNGWMLNLPSTLLFWVPPWNQKGLLWPKNTAVMGAQPTKLDLSSFVHGTSWMQCRQVK